MMFIFFFVKDFNVVNIYTVKEKDPATRQDLN